MKNLMQRCERGSNRILLEKQSSGGLDQNLPCRRKFWKPPLSGEAGPPPPPLSPREARRKFLGFLSEFSGKFRIF